MKTDSEKTEELEEKVKKLEERADKSEEDLKKHKEKDYHGRGFTKGGSIWKNIVNNLANNLVAELFLFPIKFALTVGGLFILNKALSGHVTNQGKPDAN